MTHDVTRAIVSVAVGERYVPFGARLLQSLREFSHADSVTVWNTWPPGSPSHRDMHYAFKAFAVKAAADEGFRYVMWIDAGCKAVADMEPLWQVVERDGYYFSSGDERMPLGEWISDRALEHFGVTRDEAMKLYVFGGTPVALDMHRPECQDFLAEWLELTKTGLFMSCHSEYLPERMKSLSVVDGSREIVSLDPRVLGHLSDEACFSIMAHKRGWRGTIGGLFNGPEACVRSGYDAI